MRLDFVIDLAGDPKQSTSSGYNDPINRDHTFDGHYNVNGASTKFTGISGNPATSTIRFRAEDDTNSNNVVGDGALDPITAVLIRYNGQSALANASGTYNVGGIAFSVTFLGGEVVVAGVVSNTEIGIYTADGYNSLVIKYESGATFKVGDFGVFTQGADPVVFDVPVEVVDGDGDTATSLINVALSPTAPILGTDGDDYLQGTSAADGISGLSGDDIIYAGAGDDIVAGGSGNDTIYGEAGDDQLFGEAGNDVLFGGTGNNTLTGGAGADRFVIDADKLASNLSFDTIMDYNDAEGDVIDLSALLDAALDPLAAVSGGFVSYNSSTGQLLVDTDGTSGAGATPIVVAVLDNKPPLGSSIKIVWDGGADEATLTVI
jgi:Ca2+-binding RTX toxin-like protein